MFTDDAGAVEAAGGRVLVIPDDQGTRILADDDSTTARATSRSLLTTQSPMPSWRCGGHDDQLPPGVMTSHTLIRCAPENEPGVARSRGTDPEGPPCQVVPRPR